jgi:formylglycine-generating enzyme required for sulfatase activity
LGTITPSALIGKRFTSLDVTTAVQGWVGGSVSNQGFAILATDGAEVLVSAKEGTGTGYPAELDVELNPDLGTITSDLLASNLTLGGTTTGAFSGDGSGLTNLKISNLTGQISSSLLGSDLTLGGTTTGTFAGDGTGLTALNASVVAAADSVGNFMQWVTVGNPNNAADSTGFGLVAQGYQIGKFEVTNGQYCQFLNAVAATDTNNLYNPMMGTDIRGGIVQTGASGAFAYTTKKAMSDKPVNFVTWFCAIRFCNWMHNNMPAGAQSSSTTEDGAYAISGSGPNWTVGSRNVGAKVWLPSEDEWYKAAYYDPTLSSGAGGYWLYPTQSNSPPDLADTDGLGNILNRGFSVGNYSNNATWNSQTGNVTTVGSAGAGGESAYGAADMAGNVYEWNETDVAGDMRGLRGGGWNDPAANLQSTNRNSNEPTNFYSTTGFRVARP